MFKNCDIKRRTINDGLEDGNVGVLLDGILENEATAAADQHRGDDGQPAVCHYLKNAVIRMLTSMKLNNFIGGHNC